MRGLGQAPARYHTPDSTRILKKKLHLSVRSPRQISSVISANSIAFGRIT